MGRIPETNHTVPGVTRPVADPAPGLDPATPTDADIARFLETTRHPGRSAWIARRLLRPLMSDFSLNGLLGTYPLYVASSTHWAALLGGAAGGRLLDVGAAAGDVTRELMPLFEEVVATDTCRAMVRRMRRAGIDARHVDLSREHLDEDAPFDTVTLLNVLDRCDRPSALLRGALHAARPGATVVVSLPLPYDPWCYAGPLPVRPRHRLPLPGYDFDGDLTVLAERILPSHGLHVVRTLRTPYVSGGDRRRAAYRLDSAVIVGRLH